MKFICLGCAAQKDWESRSKDEQYAFIEECFTCDDELLRQGHRVDGGLALQCAQSGRTSRWKNGQLLVSTVSERCSNPYASQYRGVMRLTHFRGGTDESWQSYQCLALPASLATCERTNL